MIDQFGRNINYMRISVTNQCNLQCKYCRIQGEKVPKSEDELSVDEWARIGRVAAGLGVERVKLTGGEPLLRGDLCDIIQSYKEIPGIREVTLTTNGVRLSTELSKLIQNGLDAVNISLDTLSREEYKRVTGKDELERVKAGLCEALESGIPLKVNAVLTGVEDLNQVLALSELIRDREIAVRFIMQMPIQGILAKEVPSRENVLAYLEKEGYILQRITSTDHYPTPLFGNGPATYYAAKGMKGLIGFIDPVGHSFCKDCNRIRFLADGSLRTCLYHEKSVPIGKMLRQGVTDEALLIGMKEAIFHKPGEHSFARMPMKPGMNEIGG